MILCELANIDNFQFSVDQKEIDRIKMIFNDLVSAFNDLVSAVMPAIHEFCEKAVEVFKGVFDAALDFSRQEKALLWASIEYPKLYHYAIYSKRYRIREKYIKRIFGLYVEEREIYQ